MEGNDLMMSDITADESERQCCSKFWKEFKAFALRGNVFELAVGIIIGTAFKNVVQSLVDDIITPPFGLLLGGVDFVNLTIKMKNFVYKDQPPVVIRYGKFLQSICTLSIIAFALFFLIKSINHLYKIAQLDEEQVRNNTETEEVKVLREIRDLLAPQSSSSVE